jgi:hypothetical protein
MDNPPERVLIFSKRVERKNLEQGEVFKTSFGIHLLQLTGPVLKM